MKFFAGYARVIEEEYHSIESKAAPSLGELTKRKYYNIGKQVPVKLLFNKSSTYLKKVITKQMLQEINK